MIGALSLFILERNWLRVGTLAVGSTVYEIAQHKEVAYYVVGQMQPVEGLKPGVAKTEFGIMVFLRGDRLSVEDSEHGGEVSGALNGWLAMQRRAAQINVLEDQMTSLSDEELAAKTVEFRRRFARQSEHGSSDATAKASNQR
jgi:hypothetical protein